MICGMPSPNRKGSQKDQQSTVKFGAVLHICSNSYDTFVRTDCRRPKKIRRQKFLEICLIIPARSRSCLYCFGLSFQVALSIFKRMIQLGGWAIYEDEILKLG